MECAAAHDHSYPGRAFHALFLNSRSTDFCPEPLGSQQVFSILSRFSDFYSTAAVPFCILSSVDHRSSVSHAGQSTAHLRCEYCACYRCYLTGAALRNQLSQSTNIKTLLKNFFLLHTASISLLSVYWGSNRVGTVSAVVREQPMRLKILNHTTKQKIRSTYSPDLIVLVGIQGENRQT